MSINKEVICLLLVGEMVAMQGLFFTQPFNHGMSSEECPPNVVYNTTTFVLGGNRRFLGVIVH